ncbi:MAG TPA: hypothetical protein VGM66_10510 [Candidatus Udaeobacter sp.]|jgi:hypothetical protein
MSRLFCVEVERTVTYSRKVWIEVEETAERLKDAKDPRWGEHLAFNAEAQDGAVGLAKTHTLTGWEPLGQPEYRAVSTIPAENVSIVDVQV